MTETSDMAQTAFIGTSCSLGFAIKPATLTIAPGGDLQVSLHPDGRIEYGQNYTPDAAAKCFWEAMAFRMPRPHPPTDIRDGVIEECLRTIARCEFGIDAYKAISALKSTTPQQPAVTDEAIECAVRAYHGYMPGEELPASVRASFADMHNAIQAALTPQPQGGK